MNKKAAKDWLCVESRKDLSIIHATALSKQFSAYIGWTGYGNLGDEAVYHAYEKLFPEREFKLFSMSKPVQVYSRITGQKVPIKCAALGGGTLINQSKIWLQNVEYLVDSKVPIFCLGTGVASEVFWQEHPGVHKAEDINTWANLLKKFIFVGVRGPLSQKYLHAAGMKAEIVGDSAISLAPSKHKKKKFKKVVGINVSYGTDNVMHGRHDVLIKEVKKTIVHLLSLDFTVKILPIWKGDVEASLQLHSGINHKNCNVVESYNSVEEYLAEVDSCDLFIGQKLHATIFSTMLRIPSIMLEYRPKCLDYMESIDMSSYSVRTDLVTCDLLMEKIQELIVSHYSITEILNEKILFYKNLQLKRSKDIKKMLKNFQ